MKSHSCQCECGNAKPKAARACQRCKDIEAQRNAKPSERVAARMAMLDAEWVTTAEVADALETAREVVSDAMGYLAEVGAVEKRWERGVAMVYRLKRRAA